MPAARPTTLRRRLAIAVRQAVAFGLVAAVLVLLFRATTANLNARGVHTGFDFLWRPAITPILNSPLEFTLGTDSFAYAFLAGALNTVQLTVAAIILSTVLGIVVGLGSVAQHPIARRLAMAYVELMRNIPVLLHIVFWYGIFLALPAASDAEPGGWLLASNRGIFLWPKVDGLDVQGIVSLSPEFAALLVGISLYTAAFIAEIVRGSLGSVVRGQWEASEALGLSRGVMLRSVIAPQALRVGTPALSSEYLGVFKNSTLAIAVGYQDFMAVGESMLTDTGQAMEVMAIVMLFYAVVSLVVSGAMHVFENRYRDWGLA